MALNSKHLYEKTQSLLHSENGIKIIKAVITI